MISFLIGMIVPQSPLTLPDYCYKVSKDPLTYDCSNEGYFKYWDWVDSWEVQWYWMFMFGLPILISLI
jgi:hypothetical protein